MKKVLLNPINAALLCAILILYFLFMGIDFGVIYRFTESDYLKFASIVLCLILSCVISIKSKNKKDSIYIVIALCFTLIADVFLLLTHQHVYGVFVFCFAQLTYLHRYNKRIFRYGLLGVAVGAITYIIFSLPTLYFISVVYAFLILLVFASTFFTKLPRLNCLLARTGMVLFILCDIHVALFNQLPRSSSYFWFASVAMWLFYLPSQVLIVLSASHE